MISEMLAELDERYIARVVAMPHNDFRARYHLDSNTVRTFDEFDRKIGDYLNQHSSACVSHGGILSQSEARSRAKEIIEREFRRRLPGSDIVNAYNDAHDGTNNGMRSVLDVIADGLKNESIERHVRDVFDRYVSPNSWSQKVQIIRELIDHCGDFLSSSIRSNPAEQFAHAYQECIRTYTDALQTTSNLFRRL